MNKEFEKIIEKLEIERTTAYNTFVKYEMNVDLGRVFGLEKAIEIVKQEAEQFGRDTNVGSNGWIPCSSGVMPRANGWYLVTNQIGVVQEQRWSANHWEKLRDDAVLAWRELPSPYQPKGE